MQMAFIAAHISTVMVLHPVPDKRKYAFISFCKSLLGMDKFEIFSIRNFLIMIQVPHKGQYVFQDILFLTADTEFHGKTISSRIKLQTGFQLYTAKIRISGKRQHPAVHLAVEKTFQFHSCLSSRSACT